MDAARYFDWAATSPADEDVLRESLEEAMRSWANPSSAHNAGIEARNALESARKRAADAIGVKESQLFFTSGGTESDHIPLLSLLARPGAMSQKGRIVVSAIEHPALREQCAAMGRLGFDVKTVAPDRNGFVTAEAIREALTPDTLFVTVMAVNNETGCIQPFEEIADAITEWYGEKRKPHFHVDCVQAAGKIPLDIAHKGIDSAAFSAHKISGPRGIGLLYMAYPEKFKGFLVGGGQEKNVRSGTENLFGAIAFAKVLEKHYIRKGADGEAAERLRAQKEMTAHFIEELSKNSAFTPVPERRTESAGEFSPWVVQASFKGIPGNVMVRALDAKGFAISTGSACSAKKQSRPILEAMGSSREVQDTAVRFSFGHLTTEEGMLALAKAVGEICADFS